MSSVKENLDLLGKKVEDKVTGFKGVVTSISFDLYGCVQALITPVIVDKEGKSNDSRWLDINRLWVNKSKPVMKQPNFEIEKGPENKPIF